MCTKSNISRLKQGIKTSDIKDAWQAAIETTRRLGLKYLWIDSLCVVQDDAEDKTDAIMTMKDIFSSAVCTLLYVETEDSGPASRKVFSVPVQPFSIYLNWSQPERAEKCISRLKVPRKSRYSCTENWTLQECVLGDVIITLGSVGNQSLTVGSNLQSGTSESPTSAKEDKHSEKYKSFKIIYARRMLIHVIALSQTLLIL